jgi:hypothetical protein
VHGRRCRRCGIRERAKIKEGILKQRAGGLNKETKETYETGNPSILCTVKVLHNIDVA